MIKSLHTKVPTCSILRSPMIGACNRGDLNREHTLSTACILTIEGRRTEHTDLQSAIAELCRNLCEMALDPAQRDAYLWFLEDTARVQDFILADGEYRLTVVADRRECVAVIRQSG
ncbi:hypothetical protein ACGF0D_10860 [Kitasatospora sp. NPDC048298]|uniref:hypothetical protein n=1 Tax=Kitasatospora sp. NPDC048298 TaxID=3364049 RepID=UPI003717F639